MRRRATSTIAGLLVAAFIVELAHGAAGSEQKLVALGALLTRGWSRSDWWRVITFSFLHLNWPHLLINAAGLVWLGGIVERRLGSAAIAAIFGGAAIFSGATAMVLGPYLSTTGIAVGASGGVFGLLAASMMIVFRGNSSRHTNDDRRLRGQLLMCLVAASAISFVPGVSLAGHLGGFVGGALMAAIIPIAARARRRRATPAPPA